MKEINFEMIGDGTADDPFRPDAFDDYENERLHYDAENGKLYLIE